MRKLQIQEVEMRLSEFVESVQTDGPLIIMERGHERAVLLSMKDYRALSAGRLDFKAWLLGGPKIDDLSLARGSDAGRDILP